MDRGRRAEPYSNASTWTREVARNMAGHLTRVSKAHSCIDTRSPISTRLPRVHLAHVEKKCSATSMNKLQPRSKVTRTLHLIDDEKPGTTEEECLREEIKRKMFVHHSEKDSRCKELVHKRSVGTLYPVQNDKINDLKQDSSELLPNKKSGNAYTIDNTTHELVPSRPHHFKHDYYKRQELRKIRQENQALIKRLQSTKTTLNTKEWEKDDKRTQEFLKIHERRRQVLQNELRRAQRSPEAVLRSKPLKSRYPRHKKKVAFNSSSLSAEIDAFGELKVREKTRRKPRSRIQGALQHVATKTDRRTTNLRDQKPSSIESKETAGDAANPFTSVAHSIPLSNNDIVTIQIASLRSQSPDPSPSSLEQSKQPVLLKVEFDKGDMVGLLGAFSPGGELESVLSAAEVSDTDLQRGPPRTAVTIEIGYRNAWSRSETCITNSLDGAPALSDDVQADKVSASEPVIEAQKEVLKAPLEVTQMLQDDQDKEESYDSDAFYDDRQQNNDKGSTDTSKLEVQDDEAHGMVMDVDSTDCTSELLVEKLEESTDDEEYSHDDFECRGRRRIGQPFNKSVASMRKKTIGILQTSDRGVYTRSRQLDFGSVDSVMDDKQKNENESDGAKDGVQGTVVKDEVIEEEAAVTDRFKRGRRSPVFWSADEEDFLRRGVEKYGIGKWKRILTDGKDVFSSHRTNVDLKDKWTNLSKNTSRKRRKTTYATDIHGSADEPLRKINEVASSNSVSFKSCQQGVVKTECINASVTTKKKQFCGESDEDTIADSNELVSSKSSQVAGSVTLKFATDKSFPELLEVHVNLNLCKDVTSLIKQLRSSILSDALPEANIQMIALESRVCLKDDELLARSIPANGMEFYLVFEESLEEFV